MKKEPSRIDTFAAWVWMGLRLAIVLAMMVAAYFLVPTRAGGLAHDWPYLLLFLILMGVIVALAIEVIRRSRFALVRSLEALLIIVFVYLLFFARFYASASAADPTAFSQPMDRVTSLYFTVTIFATVGFGDVNAISNTMKLAVTVQMLLNLVLLGGVVRLILTAGRRRPVDRTQP